jgi:DNA-binding GntR family transcriptional regulator
MDGQVTDPPQEQSRYASPNTEGETGAQGTTSVTRRTGGSASGDRTREPAYLLIANQIAEQIGAGFYRPGDQLPTEAQLRAHYGVSPMTVRRAISILLERGLVSTTQGKGTFVRTLDMGEAIFRLQEITDLWVDDDASVEVLLLKARIIPADETVATMLELSPGDRIVHLRRLIKRNGVPLIYQMEHVVYDAHRPLVEAELQVTSLEGLLRSPLVVGVPSGRLTIQAVSLDADAAAALRVPAGSPAFCLESLFHDFDGRPVSWGHFLCRADQFRLTSQLGVAPGRSEVQPA